MLFRSTRFITSPNICIVFTARCVQGKVFQVWDSRDSVDTSKPAKNGGYTSSEKHHSHEKKSVPYNVYDYSDPEDFYEDNYDDLLAFEDAEDYYNEHHQGTRLRTEKIARGVDETTRKLEADSPLAINFMLFFRVYSVSKNGNTPMKLPFLILPKNQLCYPDRKSVV